LCQANVYTTRYSAVKGFFGKTRKIFFLRLARKLAKDKQLIIVYRGGMKIGARGDNLSISECTHEYFRNHCWQGRQQAILLCA
jgi:hypothetical protein